MRGVGAGQPCSVPCTPPARGPDKADTGARSQRGSGMGNYILGKVAKASGTCQLGQERRRAVSIQICCLELENCDSSLQENKMP